MKSSFLKHIPFVCLIVSLLTGCAPKDDPTLPHSLAELDRWYVEPPKDLNAATLYLQGCAALQVTPADYGAANLPIIGRAHLPSPGDKVPPEMKSAMAEFVQRNQQALDLFEKAAALDQCRYPMDLTQGRALPLAHLNKIRRAARVIQLAAMYHALAGDGTQAGQDVLTGFALAKSLEQEPTLTSQMFRGVCTFTAANTLEEALSRVAIPQVTLSLLARGAQQAADDEASGTGLTRGIAGDRAMDMAFFDLPADEQKKILDTTRVFAPNGQTPVPLNPALSPADRQFLAESYLEILNDARKPFPKRLGMQKLVTRRAAEAGSRQLSLSALRLPPLETIVAREAMMLVQLRLAQTAVALEQFRSANGGRYPDSLSQVVPAYLAAIPRDPFAGKQLVYHQAGGGYYIYSVGPDGKDHGGLAGRFGQSDIVFSLTSPPPLAP